MDGFTLDCGAEARNAARDGPPDGTRRKLFGMFRYGWRATEAERDDYIEEVVESAPRDWLNEGIEPNLLRTLLQRCFVQDGNLWLKRPELDEIEIVSAPDPGADIFPSREIYDRISIPMLLVWANGGLSGERYAELCRIAEAAPNRRLVDMCGSHNLPMQRPVELARLIASQLLSGSAGA